jgi:hypothetical protein
MANAAGEKSVSGALRSLATTKANRQYLRNLLGLTIQPDLPPNLMKLLKDLDAAEASRRQQGLRV